jgi:hypothetical protein
VRCAKVLVYQDVGCSYVLHATLNVVCLRDRWVYVCCAGSQVSDGTRVCAYMYKTVEHLSIHNADDDESSEDYGAADVQVNTCKYHTQYCST